MSNPAEGPFSRRVRIANALGLHLRAADMFVRLAQGFQAEVRIRFVGKQVNGKSILDLMTLAAACGSELELEATGPDAEEAVAALAALVEARFHEPDQC